jgi:site-specific DNA recombinase
MFIAGTPIKTIADTLNERGLYVGAKWDDTVIRRLLDNRHYIGEVKYARKWYPGRQNPIIDRETFDKAQKILKIRAEAYTSTNKHTVPLTGFIYCGVCGGKYHRQCWKPKHDGTKKANYMCYSKSKKTKSMIVDPNCNNKTYKTDELEAIVFGEIRKLSIDPDYREKIRKDILQEREADETIRVIKDEIKSLSSQISNYMDLYSINRLTLQEVDDKIAPLAEKRDKLETDLRILTKPSEDALSPEEVEELVDSFADILDRGELDEIRLTLTTLIRKIVITGDVVEIYWNFA